MSNDDLVLMLRRDGNYPQYRRADWRWSDENSAFFGLRETPNALSIVLPDLEHAPLIKLSDSPVYAEGIDLTQKMAAALIPLLGYFVVTGHLPDPPENDA